MTTSNLTTGQREVYILPTRFGLLYGGALLLTLLVSVNYNNGLGHLFTFLLASMGVVCMHYTQRNLVGLVFSARPGKAVFAGETAQFMVFVEEQINRRRTSIWLRSGDEEHLFHLEPAGENKLSCNVKTTRRGWLSTPKVYACTLYPLGIFLSWTRRFKSKADMLVYPALAPPQPLPRTGDGDKELVVGLQRTGIDDFAGIREHQPEDGINRIHWKHSARGTGLKTKQFQGMGAGDLLLRWSDTGDKDTEARLSLLARWVVDAEKAGFRYGLELPGERIEPDQGPTHQHRCLKRLALWVGD